MTIDAKITGLQQLGPFKFRWPDTHEDFEGGWDFQLNVGGAQYRARLGIGARLVYERWRVHTVTWLDGAVQSRRRVWKQTITRPARHSSASSSGPTGRWSGAWPRCRRGTRVSIWSTTGRRSMPGTRPIHRREDPRRRLAGVGGACVAANESAQAGVSSSVAPRPGANAGPRRPLPAPPTADRLAVAAALLTHGAALAASAGGGVVRFTPNEAANAFVHRDPFAFLIAVICDQGIVAE